MVLLEKFHVTQRIKKRMNYNKHKINNRQIRQMNDAKSK